MKKYYLTNNVSACISNDYLIFIDLRKDEYVAIGPQVGQFIIFDNNNRIITLADSKDRKILSLISDLDNLLHQGLLQLDPSNINFNNDKTYKYPKKDISEGMLSGYPKIKTRQIIIFIFSFLSALISVKIVGIHRMVKFFNNRKLIRQHAVGQNQLSELIHEFRAIRSFVYTADKHCYFDCAVLMFFLRSYGFNPSWVFAVRMEPFFAHCWVQVDDVMASDYLSDANMLQPIMII